MLKTKVNLLLQLVAKRLTLSNMKAGKGCADTDKGCIRGSNGSFYILNNKKGGIWRKSFASRKAALSNIKALHANK